MWIAAIAAGALMGAAILDTRALGLDFAVAAIFAALLALQITSRPRIRIALAVAATSALVGAGTARVIPASWASRIAAMALLRWAFN